VFTAYFIALGGDGNQIGGAGGKTVGGPIPSSVTTPKESNTFNPENPLPVIAQEEKQQDYSLISLPQDSASATSSMP